uniref:Uncharacterized protein n=1 Tax=Lotus japonicus TaxID=34305 RepID=I3SAX3_LOTJA|nr:unknown [Lotus japonicus]
MADLSSKMGPAMAMNLLFLISFSKETRSWIVVNAPELLVLAIVTFLALAMAENEAAYIRC